MKKSIIGLLTIVIIINGKHSKRAVKGQISSRNFGA
jgi:hypothetical protein